MTDVQGVSYQLVGGIAATVESSQVSSGEAVVLGSGRQLRQALSKYSVLVRSVHWRTGRHVPLRRRGRAQ